MRTRRAERGAVFLEFAIVAPLFMLFFVALFDLARYFTARVVLTYSAGLGLQTAEASADLEYDPFLSTEEDYRRMRRARAQVADEATRLVRLIMPRVLGAAGEIPLFKFRHVTDEKDLTEPSEALDALVLVPGESAVEIDPEAGPPVKSKEGKLELNWRDHPDICAKQSERCLMPRANSREKRKYFVLNMLRQYPITVEVRTKFHFLLPGITPMTIRGTAAGYRERYPQLPG